MFIVQKKEIIDNFDVCTYMNGLINNSLLYEKIWAIKGHLFLNKFHHTLNHTSQYCTLLYSLIK